MSYGIHAGINPLLAAFLSTLLVLAGCYQQSSPVAESAPAETRTAQELEEEAYAHALGIHAYAFGFPWVYYTQLRYLWTQVPTPKGTLKPYVPVNTFWHSPHLTDASYRNGGAPNSDTLYSVAWVDVSREPVILSHPDIPERYFTFELVAFSADNFAYVGLRETGAKAGHFALVGPKWQGELPTGLQAVRRSYTDTILIVARTLVDGPEDVSNAHALMHQYQLTPLSQWGSGKAPEVAATEVLIPFDSETDPLAEWKTMNAAMTENPPRPEHQHMLDQFATLHLGPDQDVAQASDATRRGLIRAAKDAKLLMNRVFANGIGKRVSGWAYPLKELGRHGDHNQFLYRAATQALSGITANDPVEAVYLNTAYDVDGQVLHGSKRYQLHFAADQLPPVHKLGFWSLTLYGKDYNMVANDINRHAIGNRSRDLVYGEDGSLTLHVQGERPEVNLVNNWLPAPEDAEFFVILRAYLPEPVLVEQQWIPPSLTSSPKR